MSTLLAERAIAEVRDLHAFFVDWFRSDGDFAAFEAALAQDFRRIAPDGSGEDRATIVAAVRAAKGAAPADFAIAILAPQLVWAAPGAVLLEFIEQQYRAGETTERRSTALFTPDTTAPRGVSWRHLHETWMAARPNKIGALRG